MTPVRTAARASAVLVGLIAAIASWTHMRDLAIEHGQTVLIGNLMPLSVDGMILCATLSLADGRKDRRSAWAAILLGAGASVTANVLAAPPDLLSRCISGWPAVALIVVVEVLARSKRAADVAVVEPVPVVAAAPGDGDATEAKPRRVVPTKAAAVRKAAAALPPGARPEAIAARAGVSVATVRRHADAINGHEVPFVEVRP